MKVFIHGGPSSPLVEETKSVDHHEELTKISTMPYFGTADYHAFMDKQRHQFEKHTPVYILAPRKEKFELKAACNYNDPIAQKHFEYLEKNEEEMISETKDLDGFTLTYLTLPTHNNLPGKAEAVVLSGLSGLDFSLSRVDDALQLRIIFDNIPCVTIRNIQKLIQNSLWGEMSPNILIGNLADRYSYFVRTYASAGIEVGNCRRLDEYTLLNKFIEKLPNTYQLPKEAVSACEALINKAIEKYNLEMLKTKVYECLYW